MRSVGLLLALLITRTTALAAPDAVTFNKDVLPILQKNCQACHRPGQIGPMSFLTYEETRPWAKAIKEAVLIKRMPPWFADPETGHFANERRLRDADIRTLVDWVDGGATEGPLRGKPAPRQWSEGWNIKPDVVYEMPKPYTISETGIFDYIYILLPAKFPKDTWIVDGEILPGNRSAVHHASVIVRPPGSPWMKDARVGEPFIPSKNPAEMQANAEAPNDWFVGYVPGMEPQRYFYPERNAGRMIPAGADIFLEIHYTATGKKVVDQTRVGFVLAKETPGKQLLNLVLHDTNFEIPPGAANYPGTTWGILNEAATLVYLQPHMHLRGSRMDIKVTYPDGRSEMLVSVPRYNYQWQIIYVQDKPLKLPKGTRIDIYASWDNSSNNRFNPDPSQTVRPGQQSWNEMMVAILGVTVDRSVDPKKILSMRWSLQ